jgi:hypothetical protein
MHPCGVRLYGGKGEIRTHGTRKYAGFQDQSLKPLGHLSLICLPVTAIRYPPSRGVGLTGLDGRPVRSIARPLSISDMHVQTTTQTGEATEPISAELAPAAGFEPAVR